MLKAPTVGRAVIVLTHRSDERIRHRTEEAEAAFADVVRAQAVSSNVPDTSPAEVPRLSLRSGQKVLTLAKERIQLAWTLMDSGQPIDESVEAIAKTFVELARCAARFQPRDAFSGAGLIVDLMFSATGEPAELARLLAARFYKGPEFGAVANFDLKVGFEKDGLFRNFRASIYEVKRGMVSGLSPGKPASIDVEQLATDGIGVLITVDTNDKPFRDDAYDVVKQATKLMSTMREHVNDCRNLLA